MSSEKIPSTTAANNPTDERREQLKHQLEYYFSRANLSTDTYLVSQMNSELFVPIPIIAGFAKVRALTDDDLPILMEAMRLSERLVVDEEGMRVRPNFKIERTVLILRNIPSNYEAKKVQEFLAAVREPGQDGKMFPKIMALKADIGDNWFATFESESEALRALDMVRGEEFEGRPIAARIKSESLLKQVAPAKPILSGTASDTGRRTPSTIDSSPAINRPASSEPMNQYYERGLAYYPSHEYLPEAALAEQREQAQLQYWSQQLPQQGANAQGRMPRRNFRSTNSRKSSHDHTGATGNIDSQANGTSQRSSGGRRAGFDHHRNHERHSNDLRESQDNILDRAPSSEAGRLTNQPGKRSGHRKKDTRRGTDRIFTSTSTFNTSTNIASLNKAHFPPLNTSIEENSKTTTDTPKPNVPVTGSAVKAFAAIVSATPPPLSVTSNSSTEAASPPSKVSANSVAFGREANFASASAPASTRNTPSKSNSSARNGDGMSAHRYTNTTPSKSIEAITEDGFTRVVSKKKHGGSASPSASRPIPTAQSEIAHYPTGSILRIQLEDFVTYSRATIHPGPFMNMVMGPNGSGKSTIVAAIALGLGASPATLGRARDPLEFVKHGCERAVIEIVLKTGVFVRSGGPPNDGDNGREDSMEEEEFDSDGEAVGNAMKIPSDSPTEFAVLRRHIRRDANLSEWYLNGNPVSHKRIVVFTRALNIQLENLCQFLPQDKVSEFARLSPTELLIETQKAAAEPEIYGLHERLMELRKEERLLVTEIEDNEKELTGLNEFQEDLNGDVRRLQERESHVKTLSLCTVKLPWLEYSDARAIYMEKKAIRDKAKKAMEENEHETIPIRDQIKKAEDACQDRLARQEKICLSLGKSERKVRETTTESDNMTREVDGKKRELIVLREARERRLLDISIAQQAIKRLEEECQHPPASDPDSLKPALVGITQKLTDLEARLEAIEEEHRRVGLEGNQLQQEINDASKNLRELEDVHSRRLTLLNRFNPRVYDTYMWLQQHMDEFKAKIYGPVALELSLNTQEAARQVENTINKAALMTFVAQTQEDFDHLLRKIVDEKKWSINVALIADRRRSDYKAEHDLADIRKLGFEKYAIDYLTAPEAIMAFLCETLKLHLVPIARAVVNDRHIETATNIQKYVSFETMFEIKRSRYAAGRGELAVKTTTLRPCIFLNHQVDEARREELEAVVREKKKRQAENADKLKKVLTGKAPIDDQIAKITREREVIVEKRKAIISEHREFSIKKQKLEYKKNELRLLTNPTRELFDEEPLKEELKKMLSLKQAVVLKMAKAILGHYQILIANMGEYLAILSCQQEKERLRQQLAELESKYDAVRVAFADADATMIASKNHAKALLEKANRTPMDEQKREAFTDLPETVAELEEFMSVLGAKIEVMVANPRVLERFETQRREIEELGSTLAVKKAALGKVQEHMALLKAEWIPAVERMTQSINNNFTDYFKKMKCVGEVALGRESDDYDRWEMVIRVKFRDEEQLQRLSAHRQSGGEKSVSTILYLLSLQELSKSPFRVVDEINQGMDPHNERRVHALIVETATRTATSQYQSATIIDLREPLDTS